MSTLFRLNAADIFKGVVVAVMSAIVGTLYELLQAGSVIDWKQVGIIGAVAGLGYLVKNLFTDNTPTEEKVFGVSLKKQV